MSSKIILNSVGSIKIEDQRFYVSIEKKYREALKGIDGFSHVNILWWGSHSDSPEKRNTLVVDKPYQKGPDTVGIFASRSEIRPNPVLITTVAVLRVDWESGIVELPWIDAEKNSPVIDIKPYQPCSDRVRYVELPHWCSDWPKWYEDSAAFDWKSVFNF